MVDPKPPNPVNPLVLAAPVPKPPPSREGCVEGKRLLPKPKLGVVELNKLGAVLVVVPKLVPNNGADDVVVLPNRLPPVETAGVPNKLVGCDGVAVPNRPVDVEAGVENKFAVVDVPNRLDLLVVVELKRPEAVDAGVPKVLPNAGAAVVVVEPKVLPKVGATVAVG